MKVDVNVTLTQKQPSEIVGELFLLIDDTGDKKSFAFRFYTKNGEALIDVDGLSDIVLEVQKDQAVWIALPIDDGGGVPPDDLTTEQQFVCALIGEPIGGLTLGMGIHEEVKKEYKIDNIGTIVNKSSQFQETLDVDDPDAEMIYLGLCS